MLEHKYKELFIAESARSCKGMIMLLKKIQDQLFVIHLIVRCYTKRIIPIT